MDGDRARWNDKWRERAGELESPAALVVEHERHLPRSGMALDVAGGAGRHAIWLARRGLDVTMLEVSDVGIERAERRATEAGLADKLRFLLVDLDASELSLAPLFDLVMIVHYLNRARRDELALLLRRGGVLVCVQQTVHNLERHASPRRDFLVEPGEMRAWVRDLDFEVLASQEGWTDEGRHEAVIVARRR